MLSRISRKIYLQHQQQSAAFLFSSNFRSCQVPRALFARNRAPLQPPPLPSATSQSSNQVEQSQVDLNKNSNSSINDPQASATSAPSLKNKISNQNSSTNRLSKRDQISLLDKLQNPDEKEFSREELKILLRQDQHEQQMAMNIISESTIDRLDVQLDEKIAKKIQNNESPHSIIKSLISGDILPGEDQEGNPEEEEEKEQLHSRKGSSPQKSAAEKKAASQELKKAEIREQSKKFGIFEMDPSLRKQADALNEFYAIMEQNKDKIDKLSLPELPLREHLRLDRSLTDEEKFQVEARGSAAGAYVASPYSDPKNIPKEVLEPRVFEQGDPARMSKQQQLDFLASVKEQAIDLNEEERAEKLRKKTIIAQKLHAVEVNSKDDSRFRSLVELDTKANELQVDAPTDKDKRILAREFADPKRDTFLVQRKRVENAAIKLGIDIKDEESSLEDLQVLTTISKEALFESKKLAEENVEHAKRLERRNRLKELRKFEQSLNFKQLNTDVDFADPAQNFQGDKVPKHPIYSDLPDMQKLKALQEKYNSMVEDDSQWDIQKKRSMKRVAEFIREKLASEKNNISSVTYFHEISVDRVSSNPSMTVIYVFWSFFSEFKFSPHLTGRTQYQVHLSHYKNMFQRKREAEEAEALAQFDKSMNAGKESRDKFMNKRLNSFAKELSGMMCREMGFKYGPEIRFAISKASEQGVQMSKELAEVVPDIMQKQLIEKYESGKIPQKINKAAFAMETDQKIIDMEEKMKSKMESDQALIAQAKADTKAEKPKKEKTTLRQNKDAMGNKLKKKKAKKSQEFWDSLDAY